MSARLGPLALALAVLLEAWGLELPRSSSDVPLGAGTTLRISPAQLSLEGTPLLSLRAGNPEPGAFVPLHPPEPEPASEPEPTKRPLHLTFVVRRDGVEASVGGLPPTRFPGRDCETTPMSCHDLEAITEYVQRLGPLFPHEHTATFRLADDVPLQAAVSIIDVARGGKACTSRSTTMGEEAPPECLFHRAILDPKPVPSRPPTTGADDAPPTSP